MAPPSQAYISADFTHPLSLDTFGLSDAWTEHIVGLGGLPACSRSWGVPGWRRRGDRDALRGVLS